MIFVIQLDIDGNLDGPQLWGPFESEESAKAFVEEQGCEGVYDHHFKIVRPTRY